MGDGEEGHVDGDYFPQIELLKALLENALSKKWKFYWVPSIIPKNQGKSKEKKASFCLKSTEVNIKIN